VGDGAGFDGGQSRSGRAFHRDGGSRGMLRDPAFEEELQQQSGAARAFFSTPRSFST
jgi:hypothetical protein